MLNEACFALYEGIGTVDDLDKAIQLGLNHPMGPFALMDLIGLFDQRQWPEPPRQVFLRRGRNSQRAETIVPGKVEILEQRQSRRCSLFRVRRGPVA